jgi:2-polyprenyl-3-methyl-5-hydroxy-6-metoxy-1,4-benzoquinol methylase
MSEFEDAPFFEQMRTCRDAYRRLGDVFHEIVGAQTAYEFGCGVGSQTERLRELGWTIDGCDGSPHAIEQADPPGSVRPIDLTAAVMFDPRPCVICTETAEHIAEEHAPMIVRNIAACARDVIIFSAAPPGQEWPGHINLQPIGYWLTKFRAHGWDNSEAETRHLQTRMWQTEAQHMYCKDNFHVLRPMP